MNLAPLAQPELDLEEYNAHANTRRLVPTPRCILAPTVSLQAARSHACGLCAVVVYDCANSPAGLEHHDRRPARQRNVLSLSLHARPRVGPYGVCHVLAFRARRALPLLHVRPLRDALRSAGWRADAGEYAQQWIGVMPCALHAAHARSRHAKRASEQAEEGYYGVPRLGPPMAAACRAPVPPRWTWLAPHVVSCRPGSFPS